jgi:hypothetical protein
MSTEGRNRVGSGIRARRKANQSLWWRRAAVQSKPMAIRNGKIPFRDQYRC